MSANDSTVENWLNERALRPLESKNAALKVGTHVDRYVVEEFLDCGGSAEVYRVRDNDLRQDYALKLFMRPAGESARFMNEARALARLNHQNLARINTFGETAGRPYFVMELLKPLPDELSVMDVRRIVLGIAAGVAALHAAGLVHRDIKRANVLLRGETPVLADLGAMKNISPPTGSEASPTLQATSARVVGTPGAAAPEQLAGGKITPATDVYALGIFAHDLLGKRATPGWRRVIARATAALPEWRYQSVDAFARAVRYQTQTLPAICRIALFFLFGILGAFLWIGYRAGWRAPFPAEKREASLPSQPQTDSTVASSAVPKAPQRTPQQKTFTEFCVIGRNDKVAASKLPDAFSLAKPLKTGLTNENGVIRGLTNPVYTYQITNSAPDGGFQPIALDGSSHVFLGKGLRFKDGRTVEESQKDHNCYFLLKDAELHVRFGRKVQTVNMGDGEDDEALVFYDYPPEKPKNPPKADPHGETVITLFEVFEKNLRDITKARKEKRPYHYLGSLNEAFNARLPFRVDLGVSHPMFPYRHPLMVDTKTNGVVTFSGSDPFNNEIRILAIGSGTILLKDGNRFLDDRTNEEAANDHNHYLLDAGTILHVREGRVIDAKGEGDLIPDNHIFH